MSIPSDQQATIKVGISACLIGQEVSFDGGHKRNACCINELGELMKFSPYCPEVVIGMPVPRPTIHQIRHDQPIKVSRLDGRGDVTDAINHYAQQQAQKLNELAAEYISGVILHIKTPAIRKTHSNTLYHMQGHSKRKLNQPQRAELKDTIDNYRLSLIPLVAALMLIQHYLNEFGRLYLEHQVYLLPYPQPLKLRSML